MRIQKDRRLDKMIGSREYVSDSYSGLVHYTSEELSENPEAVIENITEGKTGLITEEGRPKAFIIPCGDEYEELSMALKKIRGI